MADKNFNSIEDALDHIFGNQVAEMIARRPRKPLDKSKDVDNADENARNVKTTRNKTGHDEQSVEKPGEPEKHVLNELPNANPYDSRSSGGYRDKFSSHGVDSNSFASGLDVGDAYNESFTGTGAIAMGPAVAMDFKPKKKKRKRDKSKNPEEQVMKFHSRDISESEEREGGNGMDDMQDMNMADKLGQNDKLSNTGEPWARHSESGHAKANDNYQSDMNMAGGLGENDKMTNQGGSWDKDGESGHAKANDGFQKSHKNMASSLGQNSQMTNTGGQFETQDSSAGNIGDSVNEAWSMGGILARMGSPNINLQEVFDIYARDNDTICLEGFRCVVGQYTERHIPDTLFESLAMANQNYMFHPQQDENGYFYVKQVVNEEWQKPWEKDGEKDGKKDDSDDVQTDECMESGEDDNMEEGRNRLGKTRGGRNAAINEFDYNQSTGRLDAKSDYQQNFDPDARTSQRSSDQSRVSAQDELAGQGMRVSDDPHMTDLDYDDPQDEYGDHDLSNAGFKMGEEGMSMGDMSMGETDAFPPDDPTAQADQNTYQGDMNMDSAMGIQPGDDFGYEAGGMDGADGAGEVGPDGVAFATFDMLGPGGDHGVGSEPIGEPTDDMVSHVAYSMGAMDQGGLPASPEGQGGTQGMQGGAGIEAPMPPEAMGGEFDYTDEGEYGGEEYGGEEYYDDEEYGFDDGHDAFDEMAEPIDDPQGGERNSRISGAATSGYEGFNKDSGDFGGGQEPMRQGEMEVKVDEAEDYPSASRGGWAPEASPGAMTNNYYGGRPYRESQQTQGGTLYETHEKGMPVHASANEHGIITSDDTTDNGLRGQGSRTSSTKPFSNKVPDQATIESSGGGIDSGCCDELGMGKDLKNDSKVTNTGGSNQAMKGDAKKLNENFNSLLRMAESAITEFASKHINNTGQTYYPSFISVCNGVKPRQRKQLSESIADIEELVQAYGHQAPELRVHYHDKSGNLVKKQLVKFEGVPSRKPVVHEGKVIFRFPEVANDFADMISEENKKCRVVSHNWGAAVTGGFNYRTAARAFKNIPAIR